MSAAQWQGDMQTSEHTGFRGAIFVEGPWQGCKLGFLWISRSEGHAEISLPSGVLCMHCHSSALMAGLRSLLLRMHLEAAQVAVFGPGRLHPAAASLGTQTFEVAQLSDASWIIASSYRSTEVLLVGVAMSTKRWRDFLQRGFFPCVPCSGICFARVRVPFAEAWRSTFDIFLHKASDFLEAIDKTGEPVIAECLAALLRCADGAHGRPVCLDGPFSLAKVINREIMYATLQKLSTAGGTFAVSTPPYFKACAGDPMAAVWARAQAQGMALPLLLKPLPACSLPGAHKFRLIESLAGAKNVEHDGIVQQFVPHNGIVYKICVVGCQVHVSERASSKSILKSEASEGFLKSRDPSSTERAIAAGIKEAFGMEILGFDVIKDSITGVDNIVDVNHLPSLKDFLGAKEALWSSCKRAHDSRSEGAAAKPSLHTFPIPATS